MQNLEEDLGFRLFERTSRGVCPTNAARSLCRSLEELELSLVSAISEAKEVSERENSTLHLYIHESFNSEPLEEFLTSLKAKKYDIDLKIDVGKTALIVRNVKLGIADIGFIHSTIPQDETKGLTRIPFKRFNQSIYYHMDLIKPKNGKEPTIDDFKEAPFAIAGNLSYEILRELPFIPKITARLDSIRSLQFYASLGYACAFLGNHQIILDHPGIKTFEIETAKKYGIDIIYNDSVKTKAMSRLKETLAEINLIDS